MTRLGTRRWPRNVITMALLLCALLTDGCSIRSTKTQAFKELQRVDTDLVRGVSTRADVLALLGAPDGRGGWLYGVDTDPGGGARDVWLYTNFDMSVLGGSEGSLSVFFRGNLYDGYFWSEDTLSMHLF